MSTIWMVVVLVLLLGGGAGYYGYSYHGRRGLGSALGMVVVVLLAVWVLGGIHLTPA